MSQPISSRTRKIHAMKAILSNYKLGFIGRKTATDQLAKLNMTIDISAIGILSILLEEK